MSGYRRAGITVLVVLMAGLFFLACAGFEESDYSGPADGHITGLVTEVPEYVDGEDTLIRRYSNSPQKQQEINRLADLIGEEIDNGRISSGKLLGIS